MPESENRFDIGQDVERNRGRVSGVNIESASGVRFQPGEDSEYGDVQMYMALRNILSRLERATADLENTVSNIQNDVYGDESSRRAGLVSEVHDLSGKVDLLRKEIEALRRHSVLGWIVACLLGAAAMIVFLDPQLVGLGQVNRVVTFGLSIALSAAAVIASLDALGWIDL